MIVSIRTYLNYLAIEMSIENVNQETIYITQKKNYEENFLIPYEQSEYAQYFLRHENNMLFPGEFIIRFDTKKQPDDQGPNNQEDAIKTPQESRNHFIQNIRNTYNQQ